MNSSELLLYKIRKPRGFDCMLRIASEEFEGLDVKKRQDGLCRIFLKYRKNGI